MGLLPIQLFQTELKQEAAGVRDNQKQFAAVIFYTSACLYNILHTNLFRSSDMLNGFRWFFCEREIKLPGEVCHSLLTHRHVL